MKKSAQVVMLPTNEKAGPISIGNKSGIAEYHIFQHEKSGIYNNHTFQHLYILSDEEIKEGDWFVGFADGSISPFVKQADESTVEINDWQLNKKGTSSNKKIIATTDKSLKQEIFGLGETAMCSLPQPSTSFIEKFVEEYNKSNVITEVMVEYEWNKTGRKIRKLDVFDHILKINPDNTINISMLKDSWSREEVVELIQKYSKECTGWSWFETDEKWIEENL